MKRTLFIHTNRKQMLGAKAAAFAARRTLRDPSSVDIRIIAVDEIEAFQAFAGKTYLRNGKRTTYEPDDLQSFTLSRFMPPELTNYEGEAAVIDPDIFALADVNELFDLRGTPPIAACAKKDAWDTSVMVMDCARLRHWKMDDILEELASERADYTEWMSLKREEDVRELPRIWNSLDSLTPETKMLHTTGRLTQPWKTGLPIDFTRNPMPKFFGVIPREPVHKLLGKYPTRYQPHPDPKIETFFFELLRDAVGDGAVTEEELREEMKKGHLRPDTMRCLEAARSS